MTVAPNHPVPIYGRSAIVAKFTIELRRNNDNLEINTPTPTIYRDFNSFTSAEREAFRQITEHILNGSITAAENTRSLVDKLSKGGRK